jgi:hypothetical protein
VESDPAGERMVARGCQRSRRCFDRADLCLPSVSSTASVRRSRPTKGRLKINGRQMPIKGQNTRRGTVARIVVEEIARRPRSISAPAPGDLLRERLLSTQQLHRANWQVLLAASSRQPCSPADRGQWQESRRPPLPRGQKSRCGSHMRQPWRYNTHLKPCQFPNALCAVCNSGRFQIAYSRMSI